MTPIKKTFQKWPGVSAGYIWFEEAPTADMDAAKPDDGEPDCNQKFSLGCVLDKLNNANATIAALNAKLATVEHDLDAARNATHEARRENGAYWKSKDDPFGQKHGRDKYDELQEECIKLHEEVDNLRIAHANAIFDVVQLRKVIDSYVCVDPSSDMYRLTRDADSAQKFTFSGYVYRDIDDKPAPDPMTEIRKMLR